MKKRLAVDIDEDTIKDLKRRAIDEDTTMQKLVEKAINKYLQAVKK